MIDGTNPRILADNIRDIQKEIGRIDSDLTEIEAKLPKDYSTTETATGQKWIDGKEIYSKVLTGTTLSNSGGQTISVITNLDKLLHLECYVKNGTYNYFNNITSWYFQTSGSIVVTVPGGNVEQEYYCIVFYTKSAPTPGRAPEDDNERIEKLYSYDENENPEDFVTSEVTDQEPEPEEKKTTKKKTTK